MKAVKTVKAVKAVWRLVADRIHERIGPYEGGGSSEGSVVVDCVVVLGSILVISEEASVWFIAFPFGFSR